MEFWAGACSLKADRWVPTRADPHASSWQPGGLHRFDLQPVNQHPPDRCAGSARSTADIGQTVIACPCVTAVARQDSAWVVSHLWGAADQGQFEIVFRRSDQANSTEERRTSMPL